jgi:hypothetical protein
MGKRILLVVFLLSFFALFVFAGGALAKDRPRSDRTSAIYPAVDGGTLQPHFAFTPVIYERGKEADCFEINPTPGVVVLEHDQWGSTWYDYQKNGSMGRMIAVTSIGQREAVFMNLPIAPYPDNPRWITYNCKSPEPGGSWCGVYDVDGGEGINAGYVNIAAMHDGREAIIYHKMGLGALWGTCLALGDPGKVCSNQNTFSLIYDIPDSLYAGNIFNQKGMWPKIAIMYDDSMDTDYIHIVMTEGKTTGGNQRLGYVRCHLLADNTLLCETPTGQPGVTSPIIVGSGAQLVPNKLIGNFGEVTGLSGQYPNTISIIVVTSPVSKKVAIVFTNKRQTGDRQFNNDVYYFESTNNGTSWFPQYGGGKWPPAEANAPDSNKLYNVSHYLATDTRRAYTDVAACYDYNDNLHIVWNAFNVVDTVAGTATYAGNIFHWSDVAGKPPSGIISWVALGPSDGIDPGGWCMTTAKMSISAKDPYYHPSPDMDSVYLFCTWTQFDTGDVSKGNMTNGDICASASNDSGRTWTPAYNLTGTRTDGCDSANCLSEHWSSLAENMYDGDLHIEYVCDKDAGGVIQTPAEGKWTLNPMMYMHVKQLSTEAHCGETFTNQVPTSWDTPPIKVSPTGSRIITFELEGIYNLCGNYLITCDHPIVTNILNASGQLCPGEKVTVEVTLTCTGEAFVDTAIYVKTCGGTVDEKFLRLPLYVVCSNDYYECNRAENTFLQEDNGVDSLVVCVNTKEEPYDMRLRDTVTHEARKVMDAGAVIIATKVGNDTVVGRQEWTEIYVGARDTIQSIRDTFWVPETDCDVQKIYASKTYVWDPGVDDPITLDIKWWWITINQQIIVFHDRPGHTCDAWKKNQVIKHVWTTVSRPPLWWPARPTNSQAYEDIYYGMFLDIDCPSDTISQSANYAGWDDTRQMVWQRGYAVKPGAYSVWNNYYVGAALTNTAGGVVVPLGMQDVRNDSFVYPKRGWVKSQLYQLAATSGVNIQDPD